MPGTLGYARTEMLWRNTHDRPRMKTAASARNYIQTCVSGVHYSNAMHVLSEAARAHLDHRRGIRGCTRPMPGRAGRVLHKRLHALTDSATTLSVELQRRANNILSPSIPFEMKGPTARARVPGLPTQSPHASAPRREYNKAGMLGRQCP